jgi:hypothetical protein
MNFKNNITVLIALLFPFILFSVDYNGNAKKKKDKEKEVIVTNIDGKGNEIELHFTGGDHHSHALIAVWIEDMEENYVQTLYISNSVANGVFQRAKKGNNVWEEGRVRRPATLPYWSHKRGVLEKDSLYIPSPEHAVSDAYTGATPLDDFILKTKSDDPKSNKYRIILEINQPFDFNEFWTNSKYPDDKNYATSGQPSVIYAVTIEPDAKDEKYYMNPIGHGHYSGKDGKLYTNISTLSSGKQILKEAYIVLK